MPLTHPTEPGFRSIEWNPQSAVGVSESPFTFKQQAYEWPGQRRIVTIRLPQMEATNAKKWVAFFLKCNGQANTFYLSDTQVGSGSDNPKGTPIINGADQTGSDLITSGWKVNQQKVLEAGDWLSIDERLYQTLNDVSTNNAGEATLEIWPKIRSAYDNGTAIEVNSPKGIFRLTKPVGVTWTNERLSDEITFTATEVIP